MMRGAVKNSLIKRLGLTLASLAVRAAGSVLMTTGLIISIWYAFLSTNDYRYVLIIVFLLQTYAGYKLIKYSFEKMYNEFDVDH